MLLTKLNFNKAKVFINEADVLLFRHPKFPLPGWWIAKYGQTPYSHVGLASWRGHNLYCVEFREFIGSREYSLLQYINEGVVIDVYRTPSLISIPKYRDYINESFIQEFSPSVAKKITDEARKFIGLSYGWKLIWHMIKTYIPGYRFFVYKYHEDEERMNTFVCSTLVSYTYQKYYADLVPFIANDYTQPSDIARSALLNYQFTITP